MGVVVASVKEEDVARLGLGARTGSIVTRVVAGGAGDRAGIQVDDVILSFEDVVGAGPNRLRWLTSIAGVGKRVHVKVARARKILDFNVALGELPEHGDAPR
jgi:serine protease Do